MMVGHTHDDVDQMFSRFSHAMTQASEPLFLMDDLMQCMRSAYTPAPQVAKLEFLYDWKTFFDSISLNGSGRTADRLHGHLRPHQFWFTRLPSSDEGRAYMRFKRLSSSEDWFPMSKDVPDLIFFTKRNPFAMLNHLPLKEVDELLFKEVFSTFKVAAAYMTDTQEESFPSMLRTWSGFTLDNTNVPLQLGTGITLGEVCDIPVPSRWAQKQERYGRVMFVPNICVDQEEDDDNSRNQILEEDVETDDEELVYRGALHSSAGSNYKTNKKMYVQPSLIQSGQFLLVRSSESSKPIDLCRVVDLMPDDEEHIQIQWWTGSSLKHTQHAMQKKRNPGKEGRALAKNTPYLDTIHIDSILTDKPFKLLKTKKIPASVLKLATKRLETVSQLQGASGSRSK